MQSTVWLQEADATSHSTRKVHWTSNIKFTEYSTIGGFQWKESWFMKEWILHAEGKGYQFAQVTPPVIVYQSHKRLQRRNRSKLSTFETCISIASSCSSREQLSPEQHQNSAKGIPLSCRVSKIPDLSFLPKSGWEQKLYLIVSKTLAATFMAIE